MVQMSLRETDSEEPMYVSESVNPKMIRDGHSDTADLGAVRLRW